MAHFIRNTDKDWPCTSCGGPGNIIREGSDPRLKCLQCNFLYNASDSEEALTADAIPEGPPQLSPTPPPSRELEVVDSTAEEIPAPALVRVPSRPAYLIVRKDREGYDVCGKREFKQTLLQWEAAGVKYDVFELVPKTVVANVSIS